MLLLNVKSHTVQPVQKQPQTIRDKRIHPLFDEGSYVFARDIGDGFEEGMSRQEHLTPHLTLVLLGWGCAGQAQEFIENLQRTTENKEFKWRLHQFLFNSKCTLMKADKTNKKMVLNLQHKLHADPVFYQSHHQVSLTLEHLVVLPGQCVGVLDGEVKVWSWTEENNTVVSLSCLHDS